jgi:hypothetical protein
VAGDITKSFDKLKSFFSFNHKGVCLERKDGGYMMSDRTWYPDIESVDEELDRRKNALNLSIERIKIHS